MVSLKSFLSLGFGLFSIATAFVVPRTEPLPGCGEVNIIFTGLPPFHPLVIAQGFNATAVNEGLRADAASIIAAGYNSRVVLMGPEQPISVLAGQLDGIKWDGTGMGYGIRGSHLANLTIRAEDIISLYRDREPLGEIIFDMSFTSALWAVQRRFPLASNCTNSPGKDLGFEIFCDICES